MSIQGYLQFWMRFFSEIFWRLFWNISVLDPNNLEFLVCLSVCQLAYILTEIRLTQGYLQMWTRHLSEIFWLLPWNVCTPDPNNLEFLVCLLVFQLAYFLTEIRLIQEYLQLWRRCFSEIFEGLPGMFVHQIQIIWNFLYVCHSFSWLASLLIFYVYQSVNWLTSLLKLDKYRDIFRC